jgi:Zn-dependent protease
MLNSSYTIGRIFGIPIKLDFSLIVLAIWMWWDYGLTQGAFAATALLLSIVLHELGHSLVGIQMGCRVREITLLLLGGRAVLDRMPRKPWQELLMALAGPAVSALLAVGSLLALPAIKAAAGPTIARYVLWHVAYLNAALCLFNLLPAFPMDGGRVLRAMLAHPLGLVRATRIAMYVGRVLAVAMGIVALWPPHNYLLLLVAFFVFTASGQEYRMVLYEAGQSGGTGGYTTPEDRVVVSPPPYDRDRKNPFS